MKISKQNKIKLFNLIKEKLLKQNSRSKDRNNMCQYRGLRGKKCAVGWLIPDNKYNKSLEGRSAAEDEILEACGLSDEWVPFLADMQYIHDKIHPNRWKKAFKNYENKL